LFLPEQPDLDWSNPDVRRAMEDVLRFWLARGADGFRVDVVHGLGKDARLPDLPPDLAAIPQSALNDDESTHTILRALRRVVDAHPGDRVLVARCGCCSRARTPGTTATMTSCTSSSSCPRRSSLRGMPPRGAS